MVLKSLLNEVDAKKLSQLFPNATYTKVLFRDGKSQGMGFVDFASVAEATKALQNMQGKNIAGRPVVMAYSVRQQPQDGGRPPRGEGASDVASGSA